MAGDWRKPEWQNFYSHSVFKSVAWSAYKFLFKEKKVKRENDKIVKYFFLSVVETPTDQNVKICDEYNENCGRPQTNGKLRFAISCTKIRATLYIKQTQYLLSNFSRLKFLTRFGPHRKNL